MTRQSQKLEVVFTNTPFHEAISLTKNALYEEGFGVLTEIDVKETFRKKLDIDFPAYTILGACNPKLAHKALAAAPEVGLFLPCNVVVKQLETGVSVTIVDPMTMMHIVESEAVAEVASEAMDKLTRVIATLRSR